MSPPGNTMAQLTHKGEGPASSFAALHFPEDLVPGFKLRVAQVEGALVAMCTGSLEGEDSAAKIQPHLIKLHEAVVASRAGGIRLELHHVAYMNSSAIKAFATWFLRAEATPEHSYAIDLVYDPQINWQRWTVGALQTLTPRTLRLVPASSKR